MKTDEIGLAVSLDVPKGGFYHDGRFAGLWEVVDHYNGHFGLRLTDAEVKDLIEHLKSL